jgi:hypothetical protein
MLGRAFGDQSPSGAAVSRLQADPVSANNKQIIFRTREFITSITGKLLPAQIKSPAEAGPNQKIQSS